MRRASMRSADTTEVGASQRRHSPNFSLYSGEGRRLLSSALLLLLLLLWVRHSARGLQTLVSVNCGHGRPPLRGATSTARTRVWFAAGQPLHGLQSP